jgi:molybdopterin synthase catalytic subunit
MTATVRLQREPFDAATEAAKLTRGRTDVGAVVTFTGVCRGDEAGAKLIAMTLEHYPGMAEAEVARHVEAAEQRWPLLGVTVIHRYGRIEPGEDIVLVVTASSHRHDAFAAAEFLMDYLKTRAPFWKQVEYADAGASKTSWVDAKQSDDALVDRWTRPAGRREAAECPGCSARRKRQYPHSHRGRGSGACGERGASGGDDVLSASAWILSARRGAGAGRHRLDQRSASGLRRTL